MKEEYYWDIGCQMASNMHLARNKRRQTADVTHLTTKSYGWFEAMHSSLLRPSPA